MDNEKPDQSDKPSSPDLSVDDPDFDAAIDCFSNGIEAIIAKQKERETPPENLFFHLGAALGGEAVSLFHYTTSEGIYGIANSGRFYASAAYFMNDSSEIDYGCEMFSRLLQKWCKQKESADTLAGMVLRKSQSVFGDINSMRQQLAQTYVVCFCEDPNLLSQWRTYGQNGGYSIGFDEASLEKFRTENDNFTVRLSRVLYEEPQQNKLLEDLLTNFVTELERDTIESQFRNLDGTRPKMFCVRGFEHTLQLLALADIVRFKHPAFKEEKEWRLIAQPRALVTTDDQIVASLKFRPSREIPIPYIELCPREKLLPITSVRYGPTLEKKRVEHALTMLFKKHGYPPIKIEGSEIPVRL